MRKLSDYVIKEDFSSNPLVDFSNKAEDAYSMPTAQLHRAITVAIESECDAVRVYTDLLEMAKVSEPWIAKPAMAVINDILKEERKHLAQLYELLKVADNVGKKDYLTGEQEGTNQITLEPENE